MTEKNQEAISKIRNFANPIIQERAGTDVQEFSLEDLSVDDGLRLKNSKLEKNALNFILNTLRVKPKFLDYQDKLSDDEWKQIATKLKKARGNTSFYGNVAKTEDNKNVIVSLQNKNEKKKSSDSLTKINDTIDLIEDALSKTDINFGLSSINFRKENNQFLIDLVNADETFAPLPNDEWKKGESFVFNSVSFKRFPMFERMVCTNGMYAKQHGFSSFISQNRFNEVNIKKQINKALVMQNDDALKHVEQAIQRLKNFNVSVHEFLNWKKWFLRKDKDLYKNIVEKYFNEAPLFAAYKKNINEMPKNWQSTADTNINAYNFLNLLTWIASHEKESNIKSDDILSLKIDSSNFLFKKNFDLENVAEKVEVEYPILPEMQ